MAWTRCKQGRAQFFHSPSLGRKIVVRDAVSPSTGSLWRRAYKSGSFVGSNQQLPPGISARCQRQATAGACASDMVSAGLLTEVASFPSDQVGNLEPICSGHVAHPAITQAAALLTAGEVVAIPTETVYGLAANALSAPAVSKVFAAKNRPADNPLIVHVSSLDMLASLYPPGWSLPPIYGQLVQDLWPGPLTILLPRSDLVPDVVTCGQPTMAVRMPAHPVALALITTCGFPLAAPSANSSGRPSPTLAGHVLTDLGGRIPLIVDGGPCTCGVESTVLDGLRRPPAILRPGGITREQLVAYPGLDGLLVYRRDFVDARLEAAPSTPGMKYRHYSPAAQVVLLDPGDPPVSSVSDEELAARLRRGVEGLLAELRGVQHQPHGSVAAGARSSGSAGIVASGRRQPQDRCAAETGRPPCSQGLERHPTLIGVLRTSLTGLRPGPRAEPVPTAAVVPALSSPPCRHCEDGARHDGSQAGVCSGVAGRERDGVQPQSSERDEGCYEYVLGSLSRPAEVASELFAALRHMDDVGVGVIVVEGVRDDGAGVAVMNRLRKAASRVVPV